MGPASQESVFARQVGKGMFAQSKLATPDVLLMACAPMGPACVLMAGMANIAHWRDVPKVATLMVSAKPITLWNGSVGVIQAGLVLDATSPWNKIAQIEKTMIKMG
jgi:hypothetical protein